MLTAPPGRLTTLSTSSVAIENAKLFETSCRCA
jgi:hypothetical protein